MTREERQLRLEADIRQHGLMSFGMASLRNSETFDNVREVREWALLRGISVVEDILQRDFHPVEYTTYGRERLTFRVK